MKTAKADFTLECEEWEQVTFEVDGFDSSLDVGEGVIRVVQAFIPFLGVEGSSS